LFLENDFATDCDLLIACIILQKQIDHINGRQENIIVPSVKMKMIRETEQFSMLSVICMIILLLVHK